jgi:hypothetical protein
MSDPVKIKVPYILDDPLVGRTMAPFPFTLFHDHIIIENGTLAYEGSATSTQKKKLFYLKDVKTLLLKTKTISCWTQEHKLDLWVRAGKRLELYLVDTKNHEHLLIPGFFVDAGERRWNKFISELCEFSGLRLEEITVLEANS